MYSNYKFSVKRWIILVLQKEGTNPRTAYYSAPPSHPYQIPFYNCRKECHRSNKYNSAATGSHYANDAWAHDERFRRLPQSKLSAGIAATAIAQSRSTAECFSAATASST